ncbi:MAG: histidine kinase [Bryobacteraceae bacterium]
MLGITTTANRPVDRYRTAGLIAAFWTLEALYSAAQVVYRTSWSEKPWAWSEALRSEFCYAWLGACLTPAILWLARRYPIDRRQGLGRVAIHLGAATVFATVMKLQWDVTNGKITPYWISKGVSLERLMQSVVQAYDLGFVLYWGILLAILAAVFYGRYQQSRLESAQLQTELVQAQLQALRAQLDPHFLFNTLHGVSELVHSDPVAAERMIAGLSELLRRSLDTAALPAVPLREELAFLEIFLDIERTRFEDRLDVRFDIAPETEDALVPGMILQPLVENAIRHGIGGRIGGGAVTVRARMSGALTEATATVVLTVLDDGDGLPARAPREGIGLRSVRGRLERLHGAESRFTLEATPHGTEARIEIPYRQSPPGAFRHPEPERVIAHVSD